LRARAFLAAASLAGTLAAPALAHEGNPNFESLVSRVDGAAGLRAEVLNGDDRLQLVNTGPSTVVVMGYDEEPYARLKPDGIVEINRRSSATYLNEDRFGKVDVPASADPKAAPQWEVVGRNGRFEFHDHRIHWMAEGDPPTVRDKAARKKVFDWTVPLRVGASDAAVRGSLWWRGTGDDGAPTAAFVAGGAIVFASLLLVVVVRTRRRRGERAPAEEAW
jgi:hypothetical protein